MHRVTQKRLSGYRLLVVGVALVYLAISSTISLLHSDDCPVARGTATTGTSFPSTNPCPACKFLAGSSSAEPHYDSPPALSEAGLPPQPAPALTVVVANPCAGSILLRAPPAACPS